MSLLTISYVINFSMSCHIFLVRVIMELLWGSQEIRKLNKTERIEMSRCSSFGLCAPNPLYSLSSRPRIRSVRAPLCITSHTKPNSNTDSLLHVRPPSNLCLITRGLWEVTFIVNTVCCQDESKGRWLLWSKEDNLCNSTRCSSCHGKNKWD